MAFVRLATLADAAGVHAIYAPIVRDTVISFEYEPPTVDEMRVRMAKVLEHFPWLVYDRDGEVLGYAYASRHSERAAYDWSANVSVYVAAEARRMGVGMALYRALFDLLRRQNIVNVYAGITLPNPASVGLHESLGMTPVGVYHQVGYKFGAWHDVGWWELALVERPAAPAPVVAVAKVSGLGHAFLNSPLRDSGVAIERDRGTKLRSVDLE
jgi:phosphinothricin acetyltransferase